VAAFVLAAAYGGAVLISRAKSLNARIPFGPFLYGCAYLVILMTAR
jgi:hypothetical protein